MSTVFRALLGYLLLIFTMRIVGRRPGRQMVPFELILIFFVGGIVLNPIIGADRSLTNAVTAIVTLAGLHFVLAWARLRFPLLGRLMDGTPLLLLERGNWQQETADAQTVSLDDVMASARASGVASVERVEYAVLERNGDISVIPRADDRP